MKMLFAFLVITIICTAAYAEEKAKLGQDDFISSTVADIFDKLGQYTSGQKRIIDSNWKNAGEESAQGKGSLGEDMRGVTIRSGTASSAEKGK